MLTLFELLRLLNEVLPHVAVIIVLLRRRDSRCRCQGKGNRKNSRPYRNR